MTRQRFLLRHREVLVVAMLFVLALVPRAMGLAVFSTLDESRWLNRSHRFLEAVSQGDWLGTLRDSVHPGITTQWTGTMGIVGYYLPRLSWQTDGLYVSGLPLADVYQPSLRVLASARVPTVLWTSVFVVLVYLVLRETMNKRIALLAALFLAFDPFFVGLSRVLHHDALQATFGLVSLLCLGLAWQRRGWGWFVASGIAAGLAFLSKSTAVVLGPLILVGSVAVFVLLERDKRDWKRLILGLLVCYGAAALTVFVVWPAMWVQPWQALQQVFDTAANYAASVNEGGNFFLGEPVDDPGALFYPVQLLLRGSPLVLFGAVVTAFALLNWLRRYVARGGKTSSSTEDSAPAFSAREMWVLLLWGLVLAYMLLLSLGIKKVDRYILPSLLAVDVLGAIGWVMVVQWAAGHWAQSRRRLWLALGLGLAAVLQVVLCLPHYPYYFSYFNPMLGGGQAAARMTLIGWGEGFDQVIHYLNAREKSEDLVLATTHGSLVDFADFKGKVVNFPPRWNSEKAQYPLAQLDYVVIYLNWLQTHPLPDSVDGLFQSRTPEFVARIGGIDYAWLYRVAKDKFLALPEDAVRMDASYGSGLKLAGAKAGPLQPDASKPGCLLPLTLYWQVERPGIKDRRLVLKWVDDTGKVWLTKQNYPAWGPEDNGEATSSWRGDLIFPDDHILDIGPNIPPGSYRLVATIVHQPDNRELLPIGADSPVSLGRFEIPAR